MSQVGNDLKAAHDLLEKAGNCPDDLHNPTTGQYCAWGALNQVMCGNPQDISAKKVSEHFEALNKHVPKDFVFSPWVFEDAQSRVIDFNNTNPGQPVIDLFAKAAADEGYDA